MKEKSWYLKRCKKYASLIRKGECFSSVYYNNHTKLEWKCAHNHKSWFARPDTILKGQWCPKCSRLSKHDKFKKWKNINDLRMFILEQYGANLISNEYFNNKTPLSIECYVGHLFATNWSRIQSGYWCPDCSSSLGERVCRETFKQIFGTDFPKIKPKNLIGFYNKPLEIDGLNLDINFNNKKYKIGFEYQGYHHFEETKFQSRIKLNDIQKRDNYKLEWSKKNNIILIQIPEFHSHLKFSNFNNFLKFEFKKNGIKIPNFDINQILKNVWRTPKSLYFLEKIQKIIDDKNGILLSKEYIASNHKIDIKCHRGHLFQSSYDGLRSGYWCAACLAFENSFYSKGYKKFKNKFNSIIYHNKKYIHLGTFETQKEACVAHKIACLAIHKRKIINPKILKMLVKKSILHMDMWVNIFRKDKKLLNILINSNSLLLHF